MEKVYPGRRKLIRLLILAIIPLSLIGKFLIPRIKHNKLLLRIKKAKIPGGGALIFGQKKIAVIKREKGIYALNLTCTHLGCTVNAALQGFVCPCHGSRFDTEGQVIKGPADRPLKTLFVKEKGNDISIMG